MAYKNFSKREMSCHHCGKIPMTIEFSRFMDKLQALRDACGFGLTVSSIYRCKEHNKAIGGSKNSQHMIGAADIVVNGENAYKVLKHALALGFTGVGINQKGKRSKRIIHLDCREGTPVIWSY